MYVLGQITVQEHQDYDYYIQITVINQVSKTKQFTVHSKHLFTWAYTLDMY